MSEVRRGEGSPLDPDNLDGHSVESLSDYLDSGRTPRDEAIESSPAAQHALAALSRLRAVAPRIILADSERFAQKTDHWITRILEQISVQAHAGRDIPISHDVSGANLSISEGAVRGIIREVGDDMHGLLIERCRLDGDIETPGAPVDIHVEISTFEGTDVVAAPTDLGERVEQAVLRHADLTISSVTVQVRDTDLTEAEVQPS